ncbi:MAG TPA: VOC family protein [Kofleriaceae bacterium]|nr:VOC family protein [Kofleriaceae bacterium]
MTFPTGRFVWFEYVSKDSAKAQAFFGELFNWKTKAVPMPSLPGGQYTMIVAGEQQLGAWLDTPPGAPPHAHWVAHLQVESATRTADAIAAAGGRVALKPVAMGDVGTYAIVLDPYGAVFALWQPAKADAGEFKGVANTFCWNELVTEHVDESVAFYEKVGGFTDAPMDMGPMGTYHVLNSDGKGRAGVLPAPMKGLPQQWVPYVQVASADDTVARAKRLGADVKMGPNDVPGVGRIAVMVDPLGSPIGILQP